MEVGFMVQPSNVHLEKGILFRITRNHQARVWWVDQNNNFTQHPAGPLWTDFPTFWDYSTDDRHEQDKDNIPLNNHIFATDFVGISATNSNNWKHLWYWVNFNEFVRVRVNGGEFAADQAPYTEFQNSSRASDFVPWRSRIDVVPNQQNNLLWIRNGPDNEIIESHKAVSPPPTP
jgi:hypothetical protein